MHWILICRISGYLAVEELDRIIRTGYPVRIHPARCRWKFPYFTLYSPYIVWSSRLLLNIKPEIFPNILIAAKGCWVHIFARFSLCSGHAVHLFHSSVNGGIYSKAFYGNFKITCFSIVQSFLASFKNVYYFMLNYKK